VENDELLEKLRELAAAKADSNKCPSCGRCPACGHAPQQSLPYIPSYPTYPNTYPWITYRSSGVTSTNLYDNPQYGRNGGINSADRYHAERNKRLQG